MSVGLTTPTEVSNLPNFPRVNTMATFCCLQDGKQWRTTFPTTVPRRNTLSVSISTVPTGNSLLKQSAAVSVWLIPQSPHVVGTYLQVGTQQPTAAAIRSTSPRRLSPTSHSTPNGLLAQIRFCLTMAAYRLHSSLSQVRQAQATTLHLFRLSVAVLQCTPPVATIPTATC